MISKGVYDSSNQKALFLKIWKKTSKVETFKKPPKGVEFHKGATLEAMAKRIEHMRKDIPSLAEAMREGTPLPYPLLVKRGGGYEMLGGRSRFGVAKILGVPVKALVFDPAKIGPLVLAATRKSFIEAPVKPWYKKLDRDEREALWKWVEGGRKGPRPAQREKDFHNHMIDEIADRIEDTLKRYS